MINMPRMVVSFPGSEDLKKKNELSVYQSYLSSFLKCKNTPYPSPGQWWGGVGVGDSITTYPSTEVMKKMSCRYISLTSVLF